MLVLSRKKNEEIVIGNGIVVSVVEIRGDKIRLGIEAPSEISISVYRQEVYDGLRGTKGQILEHLSSGYFLSAYEVTKKHDLLHGPFKLNNDELFQLVKGLEKTGELTDQMREYLGARIKC